MAIIYELYRPNNGKCIGYLTAEEADTAGLMQRAGYIVVQTEA